MPEGEGRDVLVSVRPEAIGLSAIEARPAGVEEGTQAIVQQVVYRGQTTHVLMKLDDGEPFVAFLPNRVGEQAGFAFSAGDRVWASWPAESNWAVADS